MAVRLLLILIGGATFWFTPSLGQAETALSFDTMSCSYARSHGTELVGIEDWASKVLADNGAKDGTLILQGRRYDLQALFVDSVLKSRVLIYCISHQTSSVPDAFAAILDGGITPYDRPPWQPLIHLL